MTDVPILFFVFANDNKYPKRYLQHLQAEENRIRRALKKAEREDLCKVVIRHNASFKTTIEVFQEYKDRITLFHFAGHANNNSLQMTTERGDHDNVLVAGMAGYLASQKGLQFVFLNGCATARQSELMHENGIPAIISTLTKVDDLQASEFAVLFYQELGLGNTLQESFQNAQHLLSAQNKRVNMDIRGLSRGSYSRKKNNSNWKITTPSGIEDARDWSLPGAVNNPLYNYEWQDKFEWPMEPLPDLDPYTRDMAKVFWGRDFEIRKLFNITEELEGSSVLLLYGASGVGKTSIVQAGFLSRISSKTILFNSYNNKKDLAACKMAFIEEIEDHCREIISTETYYIILDGVDANDFKWGPVFKELIKVIKAKVIFMLTLDSTHLLRLQERLKSEVPFSSVYLPPISQSGIQRIFYKWKACGQYNVEIKPGLPERLSHMLHQDTYSSITSTLQVLLSALWKEATSRNYDQPSLSIATYEELEREGFWENFIKGQLERIDYSAFQNGLLLNILQDCTSFGQFANQFTFDNDISPKYLHLGAGISKLFQKLVNQRILCNVAGASVANFDEYKLQHSLLHIPLLNLIKESSCAGLEARKILLHHTRNNTLLNSIQLALIEKSKSSCMPELTSPQNDLIFDSHKENMQRARKKMVTKYRWRFSFWALLIVGIIFHNIYLLFFLLVMVLLYR